MGQLRTLYLLPDEVRTWGPCMSALVVASTSESASHSGTHPSNEVARSILHSTGRLRHPAVRSARSVLRNAPRRAPCPSASAVVSHSFPVNLSKSGASLSIGHRGARYSARAARATLGLPGTGLDGESPSCSAAGIA
jgi:hypothetical protein